MSIRDLALGCAMDPTFAYVEMMQATVEGCTNAKLKQAWSYGGGNHVAMRFRVGRSTVVVRAHGEDFEGTRDLAVMARLVDRKAREAYALVMKKRDGRATH